MFDVVIPARNEELTIGKIVKTFKTHSEIGQVIVVIDDDTKDETSEVALSNGAYIMYGTRGKGQNVTIGLKHITTEYVILCDADISGLTSDHIHALIQNDGRIPDQVIGVPDFPARDVVRSKAVQDKPEWLEGIIRSWPWVSGERVVKTELIVRIPLHGYLMETQINARIPNTTFRRLEGVYSAFKMTERRLAEMERDRTWGKENGWLPS